MGWWQPLWHFVDSTLRGWSDTAQNIVSKIRLGRNIVGGFIFIVYGLVAAAIIWPQYDRYFLGGSIVLLSISMWVWWAIISLPLRAKSIVRLIDTGYPANAKELGIRMAARKLHEESIETEELLVATAWNEGRKAFDKYRDRARRLKDELDNDPEPSSADSNGETYDGPADVLDDKP